MSLSAIQRYVSMDMTSIEKHGGGVAIYIWDVLDVGEKSMLVPENIEVVCLEITKSKSQTH